MIVNGPESRRSIDLDSFDVEESENGRFWEVDVLKRTVPWVFWTSFKHNLPLPVISTVHFDLKNRWLKTVHFGLDPKNTLLIDLRFHGDKKLTVENFIKANYFVLWDTWCQIFFEQSSNIQLICIFEMCYAF